MIEKKKEMSKLQNSPKHNQTSRTSQISSSLQEVCPAAWGNRKRFQTLRSSNELEKSIYYIQLMNYGNLLSIEECAREPYSRVASKRLTAPPSCAARLLSCHLLQCSSSGVFWSSVSTWLAYSCLLLLRKQPLTWPLYFTATSRATACSADLRVPSCSEFLPRPEARLALKRRLWDLGVGGGTWFWNSQRPSVWQSTKQFLLNQANIIAPRNTHPHPQTCTHFHPTLIHSQAHSHVELNMLLELSFHFY